MAQLSRTNCLLLIISLPIVASTFLKLRHTSKRQASSSVGSVNLDHHFLSFMSPGFQTVTVVHKDRSMYLECQVMGRPAPTIHWLKDGQRVSQGRFETQYDDRAYYEEETDLPEVKKIRRSSTLSRLYLDCPNEDTEGEYTCVAENAYDRASRSTVVRVENRHHHYSEDCLARRFARGSHPARGEPARIYMWTLARLEYEESTVQIFCRASGYPEPSITWYDWRNHTLAGNGQFNIVVNGDLVIRDLSWEKNMGVYRCVAENELGSDSSESFLYPTPLDDPLP